MKPLVLSLLMTLFSGLLLANTAPSKGPKIKSDYSCTDTLFLNSGEMIVGEVKDVHETSISYTVCGKEKVIRSIDRSEVHIISEYGGRTIITPNGPDTVSKKKERPKGRKALYVLGWVFLGLSLVSLFFLIYFVANYV